MENIVLAIIIILCVAFIAISIIRKKPELIMDFLLKAFIGSAGIYLLDFLLSLGGYQISVGVNLFSILSNGILGLPGFILLYGLAFYYSF